MFVRSRVLSRDRYTNKNACKIVSNQERRPKHDANTTPAAFMLQ